MRDITNTVKKTIETAAISNEVDRFTKITTGVIDYARQIHFACKKPYRPFTVTYIHRLPHYKVGGLDCIKKHFGEIVPTRYELFVVVEELSKLGWLIKKKHTPYLPRKYPADWTESQIQRAKNGPVHNFFKQMDEDNGPDEYQYLFNKDHQNNNLSVKIEVDKSKKRRQN